MKTDTISDLLTRIRNAQRAGHKLTEVPASKFGERLLATLKKEGFIGSFEKTDSRCFKVHLKYDDAGVPMIRSAKRVSTPGNRVYAGVSEIPRIEGGLGIAIVSTPHGLMTDSEARKAKSGGEVIALIS